jgi:hypothetical protein
MVAILLGSACNSVYKKHYGNGYTFLKKSQKSNTHNAKVNKGVQQQSINLLREGIKENKNRDASMAEQSFETIHRNINQIEEGHQNIAERSKKITGSSIHINPATSEIHNFKTESVPHNSIEDKSNSELFVAGGLPDNKTNKLDPALEALADKALLLAQISIGSFILGGLLSLIALLPLSGLLGLGSLVLAIVSLVYAKRAKILAELNGFMVPSKVNTAKGLSWTVIGFNILALLLLILIVFLILLVLSI